MAPGSAVTWGSGDPAARVEALLPGGVAEVVLTKDVRSPCGRVWTAGTRLTLPATELRSLD